MTTTTDTAALPGLLTALRLPSIGRHWQHYAAVADREGWPAAKLLGTLLELEVAERVQRRIQRHHAESGLPPGKTGFLHPSKVEDPMVMLWIRTENFFREYRGKLVVFGHTRTEFLPQELSEYTPDDPTDLWAYENVVGIDTGCGNGGFLTCVELPSMRVYESR